MKKILLILLLIFNFAIHAQIVVSASISNPNCNDSTGKVILNATVGQAPYSYSIGNSSFQDSNVFINITQGTCIANVKDALGAITSLDFTIVAPTVLSATYSICNQSITLVPAGGTPPYQYNITLYSIVYNSSQVVGTGLPTYTYFELPLTTTSDFGHNVRVFDANGCVVDLNFQITNPSAIMLTLIPTSVVEETCAGDQDAAFSIMVWGDTTATPVTYSYSLDNPDGQYTLGSVGQTVFNFVGLAGGSHSVYMRDSNGCKEKATVDLITPPTFDPTVDVLYPCNETTPTNEVSVFADSTLFGLTATFALDDGVPITGIDYTKYNNLAAGPHSVIVGINGCNKQVNFVIDAFTPLS
jgi:large repetitive protein